jgi:hypothetical protein
MLILNLVLGWTILGWLAVLIWAVVEKPAEKLPTNFGILMRTWNPRNKWQFENGAWKKVEG